MNELSLIASRRRFLRHIGSGAAAVALSSLFDPGVFANFLGDLPRTPSLTEGPFFPDKLPLDTDNDLLLISDSITPAVGQITHLTGRVLDANGDPLRNALIEIWQVDHHGSYLHSQGANFENGDKRDKHFQGYGRFLTSSTGEYYFRTIKPVPYPGRTPHIHAKVTWKNRPRVSTQFFIHGDPMNQGDQILNSIRDRAAKELVISEFAPLKSSKIGELAAKFDVVLGVTPEA